MLQHDHADDFVVATNKAISIRDFLQLTFEPLDLDWQDFVEIDERFYRPAEVDYLLGDYSKAERELGWTPKTDVASLARMMVESDLELAKRERNHRNIDELEARIV
jgi:GDPmannose 4,6-dehydratase